MRHRCRGRRLGRTKEHRLALKRNLVASLFLSERGAVQTTREKARDAQRFAEKLITLAKSALFAPTRYRVAAGLEAEPAEQELRLKPRLATYRRALALLGNRRAVIRLFNDLAPRYRHRPGGYTRILHLAQRRVGDNASQVLFGLIPADEELTFHPKAKAGAARSVAADSGAPEASPPPAAAPPPAEG